MGVEERNSTDFSRRHVRKSRQKMPTYAFYNGKFLRGWGGLPSPQEFLLSFLLFPIRDFIVSLLRRRPGRIWEVFFEFYSLFGETMGGDGKNRRGMGERKCPEASLKSQGKSSRKFEGNLGNLIRRNFRPDFTCCFSACFRCKLPPPKSLGQSTDPTGVGITKKECKNYNLLTFPTFFT